MYRIRFAYRDGKDAAFVSESYYKARLFLQARGTIYDSDLLYAEITYCGGETCYTTDPRPISSTGALDATEECTRSETSYRQDRAERFLNPYTGALTS